MRCQKHNYVKLPQIYQSLITWFLRAFQLNTKATYDEFMSRLWAALSTSFVRAFFTSYLIFFGCYVFYSVNNNNLMARNPDWWTDSKNSKKPTSKDGKCIGATWATWRNYDNDEKKSTCVAWNIERKIEFRGIVWKWLRYRRLTRKLHRWKHEVWNEIENKILQKLGRLTYWLRRSHN